MNDYEPIIGLEIHVELKTKSKMFCGCPADWFGRKPNTVCCPVCLGLPGALPVPNRKAVEWTVMLGLALGCEIPLFSKFDRKNYFYPDLPKGYQISQYDQPFAVNGSLKLKTQNSKLDGEKIVRIRRVHLEEDTGKLMHATVDDPTSPSGLRGASKKVTLIDFNRSGVPLVEIVTEPDIRSSEEARTFLKKVYQIIRYLGISDADMEKGSMRLEPNISVKLNTQNSNVKTTTQNSKLENELPKYKVEVKNINSFAFAKKAIDYEVKRHIQLLELGKIPPQETRGWDEKTGTTISQRSKEEAQDYRYFPEPDIPPIRWSENQISNIKNQIGELPDLKLNRFVKNYELSEYDAAILTGAKEAAEYFERVVVLSSRASVRDLSTRLSSHARETPPLTRNAGSVGMTMGEIAPKIIANWIINKKVDTAKVSPEELVKLIQQKTQVVKVDDIKLHTTVEKVIKENEKAVTDYKSGKTGVIMFLVGLVMRELKGKADPQTVRKILENKLK